MTALTEAADRYRAAEAELVAARAQSVGTRRHGRTPFWFQFASCRPEFADRPLDQWVDLFFPTRGKPAQLAKDICAECPAQEACADHGLREKHGVWGGSSERERRRIRRTRLNTPA